MAPSEPTPSAERYVVMDVLRGFALFGVMLVNIWEFGGVDVVLTAEQAVALPTAALDEHVEYWMLLLLASKANTLFAFLFGLGFWVQMQRLEARGAPFKAIYLRRVMILLLIGWTHLLFFFAWDVLHIYAIAAFALFACRHLSDRTLLATGLVLLVVGMPVLNELFLRAGIWDSMIGIVETEEAILAVQSAAQTGDFSRFIWLMQINTWYGWILSGGLVGWIAYALGRFLVGAWVARQGWIQNSGDHLALFRRWIVPLLFVGFALEFVYLKIDDPEGSELLAIITTLLHAVAAPMIAAGYVCAIVLLFHGRALVWLVKPFAPVGQMALTNYLLQSVAILTILIGFGLAGKAGVATFLPMVVAFYVFQIVFSYLWMKAFLYGPAEWLWRALTYGEVPKMRRQAKLVA